MKFAISALLLGVTLAQNASSNSNATETAWEDYVSEKQTIDWNLPTDTTQASKLAGVLTYWHSGQRQNASGVWKAKNQVLYKEFTATRWNKDVNSTGPLLISQFQGNPWWIRVWDGVYGLNKDARNVTDICMGTFKWDKATSNGIRNTGEKGDKIQDAGVWATNLIDNGATDDTVDSCNFNSTISWAGANNTLVNPTIAWNKKFDTNDAQDVTLTSNGDWTLTSANCTLATAGTLPGCYKLKWKISTTAKGDGEEGNSVMTGRDQLLWLSVAVPPPPPKSGAFKVLASSFLVVSAVASSML